MNEMLVTLAKEIWPEEWMDRPFADNAARNDFYSLKAHYLQEMLKEQVELAERREDGR